MTMLIEIAETFTDYTGITTGNAPFNAHWLLSGTGNLAFAASAYDASDRVLRLGYSSSFFPGTAIKMFALPVQKVSVSIGIAITAIQDFAPFFRLLDSGGNAQLTWRINPVGKLQVTGEGGVVLATSSINFLPATVYRLGMTFERLAANSVRLTCSVNGDVDEGLAVTADFQDQAEGSFSGVSYSATSDYPGGGAAGQWEMLHLLVGTGEVVDWGPLELVDFPPTSDITKEWTRSAGADNFANVDEDQGNGDTDYNSSETTGQKDIFGFTDGEVPEQIVAIILTSWARKEDSATRKFKQLLKVGGVNYYGPDIYAAETYGRFFTAWLQNPSTAANWDPSELAALEAGYEYIGA